MFVVFHVPLGGEGRSFVEKVIVQQQLLSLLSHSACSSFLHLCTSQLPASDKLSHDNYTIPIPLTLGPRIPRAILIVTMYLPTTYEAGRIGRVVMSGIKF